MAKKETDIKKLFDFALDNMSNDSVTAAPPKDTPSTSGDAKYSGDVVTPKSGMSMAENQESLTTSKNNASDINDYSGRVAKQETKTDARTFHSDPELSESESMILGHDLIGGNEKINANKKEAGDTLRLTRLAERLNNREWTPGVTGGYATELYGSAGISDPKGYRKEPISTTDMRQQVRTEEYESQARDLQFQIAQLQSQYDYMKAQNWDKAQLDLWYQTALQGIMSAYQQRNYKFQKDADIQYNWRAVQKSLEIRDSIGIEAQTYFNKLMQQGIPINSADRIVKELEHKIEVYCNDHNIPATQQFEMEREIYASASRFGADVALSNLEAVAATAGGAPGVIKEGLQEGKSERKGAR